MADHTRGGQGPGFGFKPTLAGELVRLRPVVADDVSDLMPIFQDAEVRRLAGSVKDVRVNEAALRAWYGSRADHADRLDLAVVERATGQTVGEVVLNSWDAANESCNFRTALVPAAHGRGLGTEALRLVVGYGFEELRLHRVSLEVYAFNPRARRVYEKTGFVAEGTLRDALCWDGEWVDATVMSILAPEWFRHRGWPESAGRRGAEQRA